MASGVGKEGEVCGFTRQGEKTFKERVVVWLRVTDRSQKMMAEYDLATQT